MCPAAFYLLIKPEKTNNDNSTLFVTEYFINNYDTESFIKTPYYDQIKTKSVTNFLWLNIIILKHPEKGYSSFVNQNLCFNLYCNLYL